MAEQTTQQITPEQKAAARKTAKAAAEKRRRDTVKAVDAACERAEITDRYKDLTAEQRERALAQKNGLQKKALATWILEGKTSKEVIAEQKAADAQVAKAEKTRQNVTTAKDPEAAALAAAAKALAPERKSAFIPADAREFLDTFTVTKTRGAEILVERSGAQGLEGALENATLNRSALEGFAIGGVKDGDVRKALAGLCKGTRLYGGKFALMVLAKAA